MHLLLRTFYRIRNKQFRNIRVVKSHSIHSLIILQFCRAIKNYSLYQINETSSKSGYYFTNHGKITCRIEELHIQKPFLPISESSTISRKQKATGLSPGLPNEDHLLTLYYKNTNMS